VGVICSVYCFLHEALSQTAGIIVNIVGHNTGQSAVPNVVATSPPGLQGMSSFRVVKQTRAWDICPEPSGGSIPGDSWELWLYGGQGCTGASAKWTDPTPGKDQSSQCFIISDKLSDITRAMTFNINIELTTDNHGSIQFYGDKLCTEGMELGEHFAILFDR
jgi:hypothetical protein